MGIDRLRSALFRSGQDPEDPTSKPRLLQWQIATVKAIQPETPRVKTFTLSLPDWMEHQPGQHYDVRLTAPDGYQAQRSYSVASAPDVDASTSGNYRVDYSHAAALQLSQPGGRDLPEGIGNHPVG